MAFGAAYLGPVVTPGIAYHVYHGVLVSRFGKGHKLCGFGCKILIGFLELGRFRPD